MSIETKIPGVTLGGDQDGTHLQGHVEASFAQLRELLGEPNAEGDGYKVSTEWIVTFQGQTFTLYDYKETSLYDPEALSVEKFRELSSYAWHVGGKVNAAKFIEALQKRG